MVGAGATSTMTVSPIVTPATVVSVAGTIEPVDQLAVWLQCGLERTAVERALHARPAAPRKDISDRFRQNDEGPASFSYRTAGRRSAVSKRDLQWRVSFSSIGLAIGGVQVATAATVVLQPSMQIGTIMSGKVNRVDCINKRTILN